MFSLSVLCLRLQLLFPLSTYATSYLTCAFCFCIYRRSSCLKSGVTARRRWTSFRNHGPARNLTNPGYGSVSIGHTNKGWQQHTGSPSRVMTRTATDGSLTSRPFMFGKIAESHSKQHDEVGTRAITGVYFKCHSIILHVISYVLLHSALYVAYDMYFICCLSILFSFLFIQVGWCNGCFVFVSCTLCVVANRTWRRTKKTRRRAGREHTT